MRIILFVVTGVMLLSGSFYVISELRYLQPVLLNGSLLLICLLGLVKAAVGRQPILINIKPFFVFSMFVATSMVSLFGNYHPDLLKVVAGLVWLYVALVLAFPIILGKCCHPLPSWGLFWHRSVAPCTTP